MSGAGAIGRGRREGERSARFDILTVFGGWLVDRTEAVWLGALIELLDAVGLHERAVRAQVQRMAAEGWFEVERVGRRSRYRPTDEARAELRSGDLRVLEQPQPSWDGTWTLVIYEMPSDRRLDRDRLRINLQWLGFGQLTAGTWISPHRRRAQVEALVDRLDLHDTTGIVPGATLVGATAIDYVRRSWNLDHLDARYKETADLLVDQGEVPTDPRDAFAKDMVLLKDLLGLLRVDPNLPAELLPPDWPGTEIRADAARHRAALEPLSDAYVTDVLRRHEGPA
jgi:phenylacetic acid degradation operon negative regulatory protein